jgi:putative component of membrane protein insertase Oxa1/YidC/SpoIIIJ protein YidD
VRSERLGKLIKVIDLTESRVRDLPTCSYYTADISCKILGFHGGDYDQWRLLGCKTPVRTSLEIHYISATESSRLMLCKI